MFGAETTGLPQEVCTAHAIVMPHALIARMSTSSWSATYCYHGTAIVATL